MCFRFVEVNCTFRRRERFPCFYNSRLFVVSFNVRLTTTAGYNELSALAMQDIDFSWLNEKFRLVGRVNRILIWYLIHQIANFLEMSLGRSSSFHSKLLLKQHFSMALFASFTLLGIQNNEIYSSRANCGCWKCARLRTLAMKDIFYRHRKKMNE